MGCFVKKWLIWCAFTSSHCVFLSTSSFGCRYWDCLESDDFYFTMLTDVKGRCWWYGSWGWTFPPICHYNSSLCDKMASDMEVPFWSKGGSLSSSMRKKWRPLIYQHLLNTDEDQTVAVSSVRVRGGWCISAEVAAGVGDLHSCRFLCAQPAGSCSLLGKRIVNCGDSWKIVFCSRELV